MEWEYDFIAWGTGIISLDIEYVIALKLKIVVDDQVISLIIM